MGFKPVAGKRRIAMTVAVSAALFGCGQEPAPTAADAQEKERAEARAAEVRLMADPTMAGPELGRRLAEHVRRSGQTLVLRDRRLVRPILEGISASKGFTIAAIPATTPWMVKCAPEGLGLAFGGWISGEVSSGEGDIGPDLLISLTNVTLSEQQCAVLVVLVSNAVIDIIKGNSATGPN
jgi:hypothetical protein